MSVVLTKEPIIGTMHGRGGFPVRTLIYAVFILLLVYMFYIYNSSQNNLREAEMTGSRYKREAEERVSEIQDLVRAKDRFQETCQNEKSELNNRIKSLNQQYSMVQSQYKETEADFIKLRQDMDTLRAEHSQADSSHAAEYEKLKQEKDSLIAKLRDEVADLTEQHANLGNIAAGLRQKVAETENANRQLLDQNARLQKIEQYKPSPPLQLHQDFQESAVAPQPQDKLEHIRIDGQGVSNTRKFLPNPADNFGKDIQGKRFRDPDIGQLDQFNKGIIPLDDSNIAHQVQPPRNNNVGGDDDGKKGFNDVNFQSEVNPNDEQKGQILEPVLGQKDSNQGGGEDGVLAMNARREEEIREKNEQKEEADNLQHQKPLALGQIEIPRDTNDLNNPVEQKNADQQLPPLLNEENEQKEQERGNQNVRRVINPVDPDTV